LFDEKVFGLFLYSIRLAGGSDFSESYTERAAVLDSICETRYRAPRNLPIAALSRFEKRSFQETNHVNRNGMLSYRPEVTHGRSGGVNEGGEESASEEAF
jgi:hypothetical protein